MSRVSEMLDNSTGILRSAGDSSNITGSEFPLLEDLTDRCTDLVCKSGQSEVSEHHYRADQD